MTLIWTALVMICLCAVAAGLLVVRVVQQGEAAMRRLEIEVIGAQVALDTARRRQEEQRLLLMDARDWIEAQKLLLAGAKPQ